MKRGTVILIAFTTAALVAELVYVPFEALYDNGLTQSLGYAFIFRPPPLTRGAGQAVIDWGPVSITVLLTAFIAGLWYFFHRKWVHDSSPPTP